MTREYFKPSIKSLKKKGGKGKRGKQSEGPTFELVLGDDDKNQASGSGENEQVSAAAAKDS